MAFCCRRKRVALRSLQPEVNSSLPDFAGATVLSEFLEDRMQLSSAVTSRTCIAAGRLLSICPAWWSAPRVYQHDQCPRFLTRPQIDAVLAVIDRTTPVGRRDYAMMLLLTVYGLRGVEVAHLRLDDIDWRNKQLHIRGRKSGNSTTYPLATSVDDAIVDYLRNGRPASSHREVFLSVIAPFRPLASGCGLGQSYREIPSTGWHRGASSGDSPLPVFLCATAFRRGDVA